MLHNVLLSSHQQPTAGEMLNQKYIHIYPIFKKTLHKCHLWITIIVIIIYLL